MNTATKTPITRRDAASFKTIPIASKSANNDTYRPSFRTVSAIVPEADFREFPGFIVEETSPAGRSESGTPTPRTSNFYRVGSLEEVAAIFAEPLPA